MTPIESPKIPSVTPSSTPQPSFLLPWTDFFKYRSRLRLYSLAGGILTSFGFLSAETIVLSQPIFDPTMTIFGMDPMIALGLGTITGVVTAFSLGSTLSKITWRFLNPTVASQMDIVPSKIFKVRFDNFFILETA